MRYDASLPSETLSSRSEDTDKAQDREPEPRFTGGPSRGDFGGGGRGGFGGGFGGPAGGGAGGRQLYVSNVGLFPSTIDI